MKGSIPYFHEIKTDNFTCSVDMISIKATLKHGKLADLVDRFTNRIAMWNGRPYMSTVPNKYHFMFSIPYDHEGLKTKCSMQIMIGQNEFKGTIKDNIKIVFNPNKVLSSYNSRKDYAFTDLAACFEYMENIQVSSFDLALDFPLKRSDVTTMPCWNRAYQRKNGETVLSVEDGIAIMNADDYTQYVGKHQDHGFLKIYNKAIESGLEEDITRVEYTIKPDEIKDTIWTPVYYNPIGSQMEIPEFNCTNVNMLLAKYMLQQHVPSEHVALIKSRYLRKKIQALVLSGYKRLDDINTTTWFKDILAEIQKYVNGEILNGVKRHVFLSDEMEHRIYSRRRFCAKYYKIVNDKRIYVCDFTEEQIMRLSDDEFNEGVLYFLQLEGMTESINTYKPYGNNTKKTYKSALDINTVENMENGFMDVSDVLNEIPESFLE